MEPLSAHTRRLYLLAFVLLFCAILPVVILYADGWRYRSGYGFVRTGGIYVSVPYADADVYVNGEHVGQSGFLERSFYIPDLAPSAYIVHIEREGYESWDRLLVVEQQLVTDARTVLIPQEVTVTPIAASSTATTTRIIPEQTYDAYLEVFATTTVASSTIPVAESDGVGLFIDGGRLFARWMTKDAFPPSQFCIQPSSCADEIVLEQARIVSVADFFRGGVVYLTTGGRVEYIEVDIREVPVRATLYTARGADMRVIDDSLIIKNKDALFEIEF